MRRRLVIGNVGDSKAILARGVRAPKMMQLTEDHYPTEPAERERIVAAGGRVAVAVDVQLGEVGGYRVWKGESTAPGLPLSRSIGDPLAKEIGVTAEPFVREITIKPEDRFLVSPPSQIPRPHLPRSSPSPHSDSHPPSHTHTPRRFSAAAGCGRC